MLAYSQTVYNWIKLFHVLAAVIWVGGDVMILIMSTRLLKENDPQREVAFVHDLGQIGQRILAPVSMVLIVFALSLVAYAELHRPLDRARDRRLSRDVHHGRVRTRTERQQDREVDRLRQGAR